MRSKRVAWVRRERRTEALQIGCASKGPLKIVSCAPECIQFKCEGCEDDKARWTLTTTMGKLNPCPPAGGAEHAPDQWRCNFASIGIAAPISRSRVKMGRDPLLRLLSNLESCSVDIYIAYGHDRYYSTIISCYQNKRHHTDHIRFRIDHSLVFFFFCCSLALTYD